MDGNGRINLTMQETQNLDTPGVNCASLQESVFSFLVEILENSSAGWLAAVAPGWFKLPREVNQPYAAPPLFDHTAA